jgi:lipopolysaccharide transport system permease protein
MLAKASPVAERVLRSRRGMAHVDLLEFWRYRELFWFLSWRDILVRYKQTYLGIAWAVLQPVLTMAVLVFVFGRLSKLPSHGAPYTVLVFAGLLPWQFFSNALSESSNSLVASAGIISKVYFPRLIIPVSAALSGVVDFVIACGLLAGLMMWHGVELRAQLLFLPLFFGIALLAAFAGGVWLSALNVKYRDVKYVVPFVTRIGLYVSPVGFISGIVPEQYRFWYSLNPLVGVIDGFRWCIFGDAFAPLWPAVWIGLCLTVALLISGLIYFRSTERTFADLI